MNNFNPNLFYGNKAGGQGDNRPPAGQALSRFRNVMDQQGVQFSEDYFVYQVPQQNQANSAVSLLPGASISLPVSIMQDAAFEWIYTTGQVWNAASPTGPSLANPNILVQVTDQTSSRNLFSMPIPWSACVGTAQQPFILPIARRFMSKTTLIVTLTNYDLLITYKFPSIALCGKKVFATRGPAGPLDQRYTRFREWQVPDPTSGRSRLLSEDLFAYVANFPTVTAAGNGVFAIATVEADSDFEWMMTTGFANSPIGAQPPLPFGASIAVVSFADGGAQRGLQNNDLYAGDVIGSSTFPFYLTVPRMFLAKTPILIKLQSLDSTIGMAAAYIVLWGRKIFEAD